MRLDSRESFPDCFLSGRPDAPHLIDETITMDPPGTVVSSRIFCSSNGCYPDRELDSFMVGKKDAARGSEGINPFLFHCQGNLLGEKN